MASDFLFWRRSADHRPIALDKREAEQHGGDASNADAAAEDVSPLTADEICETGHRHPPLLSSAQERATIKRSSGGFYDLSKQTDRSV